MSNCSSHAPELTRLNYGGGKIYYNEGPESDNSYLGRDYEKLLQETLSLINLTNATVASQSDGSFQIDDGVSDIYTIVPPKQQDVILTNHLNDLNMLLHTLDEDGIFSSLTQSIECSSRYTSDNAADYTSAYNGKYDTHTICSAHKISAKSPNNTAVNSGWHSGHDANYNNSCMTANSTYYTTVYSGRRNSYCTNYQESSQGTPSGAYYLVRNMGY